MKHAVKPGAPEWLELLRWCCQHLLVHSGSTLFLVTRTCTPTSDSFHPIALPLTLNRNALLFFGARGRVLALHARLVSVPGTRPSRVLSIIPACPPSRGTTAP